MELIDTLMTAMVQWLTNKVLEGVFEIYQTITNLPLDPTEASSYIAGIQDIAPVFTFLGGMLLLAGFYIQITATVASPLTGNDRLHPAEIVLRFLLTAMLLGFCQPLLDQVIQLADTVFAQPLAVFAENHSLEYTAIQMEESGVLNEFWRLLLTGILAYNVILAALNQAERFLTIWIEYYMSPLAVSFFINRNQSDIPKQFFANYVLQIIVIFLNDMLMRLSLDKIDTLGEAFDLQGYVLAIALISLAANSEKLVRLFGGHLLPTMDGARNFMHAGMTTLRLAGQAATFAGGVAHTAGSVIGHGVGFATSMDSVGKFAEHRGPGEKVAASTKAENAVHQAYRPKADASGRLQVPDETTERMDSKVLSTQIGATDRKRKGFLGAMQNLSGSRQTQKGMQQAFAGLRTSVRAYNDFVAGQGGGTSRLTNAQVAEALGLSQSLPQFHYDPDGFASYDAKTGGVRIHGWEKDRQGRQTEATYAFGTQNPGTDTSDGQLYSKPMVGLNEEGGEALYGYRVVENQDLSQLFVDGTDLQEDVVDRSGAISAQELTNVIHPAETMHGFEIANARVSPEGYLTMNGQRINEDGSITHATYLISAEEVPATGCIGDTGGVADITRVFDLGNGYTAYALHPGKKPSYAEKEEWDATTHSNENEFREPRI